MRSTVKLACLVSTLVVVACSTGSVVAPPPDSASAGGATAAGAGGSAGTTSTSKGGTSSGGTSQGGKGGTSSAGTSQTGGTSAAGTSQAGGTSSGTGGSGSGTCPPTKFSGLPACSQPGKAACITCACNDLSQQTLCAAKYAACLADTDCAHTVECVLDGCPISKCQDLVNNSLQKLLDLQPCFQTTCMQACADIIPGSGGSGGSSTGTGGSGTGGSSTGGKGGSTGTVCVPNSFACMGTAVEKCAADGSAYSKVMDCATGTTCDASSGMCKMGSGCGMAWEVTYTLNGTFSITDTTLGAGNADKAVSGGTMKIRFEDKGGMPGGKAHILSYTMPLKFSVSSAGLTVDTNVTASVPYDPCGHASGVLTAQNLAWDACTYGPTWNTGPGKWHGDANAAMGVGCLNDYTSAGNVHCSGGIFAPCSAGNLKDGDNPQMGTWSQPLNGFEFAADMKSFKMAMLNAPSQTASYNKGVETPNAQPSRTWFKLDATEMTRTQIPAPCSCP